MRPLQSILSDYERHCLQVIGQPHSRDTRYLVDDMAEALRAMQKVADAGRAWLKAYEATGPDNGPSLTEQEAAELMRAALEKTE